MKAKLCFIVQPWTGWTPEQPQDQTFELEILSGHTYPITPKILQQPEGDDFYNLTIIAIDTNQIKLGYKGLVIRDNNEGIDLNASREGEATLQVGQSLKFSTPTMDGGTNITITLNEIK